MQHPAIGHDDAKSAVTFREIRSKDVDSRVSAVVGLLLVDQVLPESNRDHALGGDWAGYRECHIKPDLLLIYRKPDADTLRLARLGSHSELFG